MNDTLQVGRSGPASVQPWAPVPRRPLASPFSSFSLAHPMVLLGGDYSGAVSEWVGRDFGWRKWEDGTVSPDGAAVWTQGRSLRMRYSCLATAAFSSSGGGLIPDCTRAPAQVCPLLINDV